MAYEKVLLVDDEEEFISALSERMETRGIKVDTAASGKEALKRVEGGTYDAIILDLQMPEMDGIETLKLLQAKNPDLQIILLSGYATLEKGIEAVKLGAIDFLEKPADIHKLMEIIREASNRKMMLVEKRAEDEIKKIFKTKGW